MTIKNYATSLARDHGTRDPFRIARGLGYIIVQMPLAGIRGYYQYIDRCHVIYIDNRLDENKAAFVCAHEIGHSKLHKGFNRLFMDTRTFAVTSKFEIEANKFAVDLLFDDDDLQNYLDVSLPTIARDMGVSYEMAEYRMSTVRPDFFRY